MLLGFDANGNQFVDPEEIVEILKALLKENPNEVDYVIINYFRYTKGKGPVSFEEFARFFLGLHCGELAVQRLHREGYFSRGREFIMNEKEFVGALNQAFGVIRFNGNESDMRQLFRDINTDRSGWISYQQYFEALKDYFGYRLHTNIAVYKRSAVTTEIVDNTKFRSRTRIEVAARPIWEELGALLRSMLLVLLSERDRNNTYEFEREEIIVLLRELLRETPPEIEYVIKQLIKYDPDHDDRVTFDELVNFILEIHCGEIALQRLHREKRISQWEKRLLALSDFLMVMKLAFSFLNYQFRVEDLTAIFQFLDTDHDGFITYYEYFAFIRAFLGSRRMTGIPNDVPSIAALKRYKSVEEEVGDTIRQRTLELLANYDFNKDLKFQREEIVALLKDVFGETKIEIDYVVLNVSRYDQDGDGNVTYDELANFILEQHCGEITLQRLHKAKKLSKWEQRLMNLDEFSLLMRESFSFVNMKFRNSDLKEIFGNLDVKKEGWIPYNKYFQLIREYMVSKRGSGSTLQVAPGNYVSTSSYTSNYSSAPRITSTRVS